MVRLAIITSHPIQYYAPWFRYLHRQADLDLRVFYLWDFGLTPQADPQFNQTIQWDIPLLEGYPYEWVPNRSRHPGTHHLWGLQNPTLTAQIAQFHPDATLLMNYNYASLYGFMARWRGPLLFRGDSHCLVPETGPKAALKRQWIGAVYRRFAACLYVGQANRAYFRYHGVPDDRLFFCPHAIDNARFMAQTTAEAEAQTWRQQLGIAPDRQVILFAGKFIAKKRPMDLLTAFLQAHTQGHLPNAVLLFVGSGELEASLRQQAAGAPVYFAPFQNQTQMPRTYAAADVVVLPSGGRGETWGLAINEAMAMGRPAIVSDQVGCAADLVISGQTGLVFPTGDTAALATCLHQALADPVQLQRWSTLAQDHIQGYSYRYATEGLLKALATLQKPVSTVAVLRS